jgi:RimJ/RimL family protein N-acetyltransferase
MPHFAEPAFRRKGFASTALQLLLSYATSMKPADPNTSSQQLTFLPLPRKALVVRIGIDNAPSIALFEKLGFAITRRIEIFQEVEMRFNGSGTEWASGSIKRVVFV